MTMPERLVAIGTILVFSMLGQSPITAGDGKGGLKKTEPTALAAGAEGDASQSLRPEASADGSRNKAFSSVQGKGPYESQVRAQMLNLVSPSAAVHAGAIEALGVLRARAAQDALLVSLRNPSSRVRRQAALALAWCGGRKAVGPLLAALDDDDWVTRQAAHVALTNLTGMQFPLESTADHGTRAAQTRRWHTWWTSVRADQPPTEVLELLDRPWPWKHAWSVTASSTYKGPPDVLVDRRIGPQYWQTKNVPFPQSCTVDLGRVQSITQVMVQQYGPEFVMTEYELATSADGKMFDVVEHKKRETPVRLVVEFPARQARFVQITSFSSKRPTHPTTFFEIQINGKIGPAGGSDDEMLWRLERGLRALGTLGGAGATEAILDLLGTSPPTAPPYRSLVRAGIRALGQLRDEAGYDYLIALLDDTMWARSAAEALGDFGASSAVPALLAAYPRYAKRIDGTDPRDVPRDDKMTFPSEDRMLETPYAIAFALSRLPIDAPDDLAALRQVAPLLMANLPGDHDTFMCYRPEVGHLLTRHLLNQSGLRQAACEHALEQLGQPRRIALQADEPAWPLFPAYRISSWLPAICTQVQDVPRLIALLEHESGWVRMNAAKSLAWIGDRRAIEPIARLLAAAKAEADHGYSGTFKDEEYNDPAPRWRESLIRALGLLGADQQTECIAAILNDERSVLEIRHAAAEALADLGNELALDVLREASISHSFHSIRHVARDALQDAGSHQRPALDQTSRSGDGHRAERHGDAINPTLETQPPGGLMKTEPTALAAGVESDAKGPLRPETSVYGSRNKAFSSAQPRVLEPQGGQPTGVVFIKGSNSIPNTIGTVEQADRWRETYVVTDSGPVHRPGRNLYLLQPPRPNGRVTAITDFEDGYVGEPELSWNASHVIFTHRGQADPWWHVYRVNLDGSGLEQLTDGPYHDVGPAYLPDGRIVFATSRAGIRDEYHGYPCTALWAMNADGSNMQPIATNIGRDNEPAVLGDGRIAFSRLEVFYSRNKTELTLHAARPDGTQDEVLYGPERRAFWRNLDHGPKSPADGQEAPLTHRVLRMTQPQPMPDGQHIVVVTQGGLALVGRSRDGETIITPDNKTRSYTTPFPLPDGRLLCASTLKTPDREQVDLGLYLFDPTTRQLELIYNDPATADFEPRPVLPRRRPPVLPPLAKPHEYSGRFVCASVFQTQEPEVRRQGRLVRVIEGVPVVGRHSTHTNDWPVWKNHGGTLARVLGTAPLAPDGSFHVQVPADRLLQIQVLNSDRRVVGNQLTWIYPRPGETKSCVGCHENPNTTPRGDVPLAIQYPPLDFLPYGDEFRYRAKAWFKGHLPPDVERRMRTVRAVNLMGR